MTYNAITAIECLVEDYGWHAVIDLLIEKRQQHQTSVWRKSTSFWMPP